MKQTAKKIVVSIITFEARLVLKKYKPKIVGITGSVGKTSTKDAIYTVLASSFSVRKSQKSFNSEIGMPLTILGLSNGGSNILLWLKNFIDGLMLILLPFNYPKWLVLEIGADKPGDIESVVRWLKPDIAVITRLAEVPVHVEFFPTIDDLINEKKYLARALGPEGVLILNYDDKRVLAFGEGVLHKKFSYGFEEGADILASGEKIVYAPYDSSDLEFPEGMAFNVAYQGIKEDVVINGGLGAQHIYPVLAAFAVGVALDISPDIIALALKSHRPPKGRMHFVGGERDTLIIDDTYNSSPVAVHAALHALSELKCIGRKIAVLGDMLELGQYSVEEHRKVGEMVKKYADMFVAVGVRSRGAADAALDAGMDESNVLQFETSREAGTYLESIIQRGDIILVKGSQSMRMERVVEEIMAHPEKKEDLLVRQDKEWQARK